MIVRVSGRGQYELDDSGVKRLEELDRALTDAMHGDREKDFHKALEQTISYVCGNGKEVSHDTVLPSDVIVPPDDITLAEAKHYFHDDGHLVPLPA